MKSSKNVISSKNDCSWFDSHNARLIILCATLGVFGAHKFAQHKNFQGIIYILLDLTLVGIILTLILSWFDLIFLTAKSDNRPGNMMFGAAFILLESFVLIHGSSNVVVKNINPLFVEAKDSFVSVESSVADPEPTLTEDEVIEDKKIIATVDGETVPVFTTENGEVPEKITVEQKDVVFVVEQPQKSENNISEPAPVVTEKAVETVVKTVEPVKAVEEKKDVVQPAPQPKQVKKSEASVDNKGADDDFGSFSLYNMITGA